MNNKYPLSNACGQLGQRYSEYHCADDEKHMECEVDTQMEITGVTHAKVCLFVVVFSAIILCPYCISNLIIFAIALSYSS